MQQPMKGGLMGSFLNTFQDPLMQFGLSMLGNSQNQDFGTSLMRSMGALQNAQQMQRQSAIWEMQQKKFQAEQEQKEKRQAAQNELAGLMSVADWDQTGWQNPDKKLEMSSLMTAYPEVAKEMVTREYTPKEPEPYTLSAGARRFDGNNNQVAAAPFKPDDTLTEIYDPTSPTGTRLIPRSEAINQPGKPKSTTSLEVGPNGELSFTQGPGMQKTIKKEIEGDSVSVMQSLARLNDMASLYQDEHLTYAGQAKSGATRIAEKAGLPVSGGMKDQLASRTKFINSIEQFFNQYRKEITGAAASVQELDRLKKSMLNADMSPTEFQAAYQQFVKTAQRQLALNVRLRNAGLKGDDLLNSLNADFFKIEEPASGGWSIKRMD